MSKDKDENFSLIDLDDSILKSAIIETTGRELTEEEIEDIALEQMETDEGFLLEEKKELHRDWPTFLLMRMKFLQSSTNTEMKSLTTYWMSFALSLVGMCAGNSATSI